MPERIYDENKKETLARIWECCKKWSWIVHML